MEGRVLRNAVEPKRQIEREVLVRQGLQREEEGKDPEIQQLGPGGQKEEQQKGKEEGIRVRVHMKG
jgi:hypothetical protein